MSIVFIHLQINANYITDIAIGYGAHIYTANNGTVIFTGYNKVMVII